MIKEFAKIGKQIIRQLSSTVEKYKDIEDHMDLDAHGNPTIKTVAEHHRLSKSQISQLIFITSFTLMKEVLFVMFLKKRLQPL